ncbi:hypothetical protein PSOS111911_20735 [Pseudoalteromonas ostreae]
MSLKDHFELLAAYNQRMNLKVYKASSQLCATNLAQDRGAFLVPFSEHLITSLLVILSG